MFERLKELYGRYPELLLAWDDAKYRAHRAMVHANNREHISVLEAEMDLEAARSAVDNCKHEAACAWMWGFRCAVEAFPELPVRLKELLPTADTGSVWDQIGV